MLAAQKTLLVLNCVLLLASITALVLNIYAFVKRFVFMSSEPFMTRSFITLMVLSVTVGISSILGILTKNMRRSIIITNIISASIFAIAFLGIAIGSRYVPSTVLGNQDCFKSDIPWIASGKKANSWGFLLCASPLCYCQMTNYNGYNDQDIKSLNVLRPNRNSKNQYFHIQQCAPYILAMINDNYTLALSNVFGMIQEEFRCSGWCEYTNFSYIYIFSNVNNGKPKEKACYNAIRDYVYKVVAVGRGFAYFISSMLLAVVAINVFLFCKIRSSSRRREQVGYSLYEDNRSYVQQ